MFQRFCRDFVVMVFGMVGLFAACDGHAQEAQCGAGFARAGYERTDGLLPVFRNGDESELLIGVPTDNPDRDYIFSTYVERSVAPFTGAYTQNSIVRFKRLGENLRLIETASNLTFAPTSPLARTREISLSDSKVTSLEIVCDDAQFLYAKIKEKTLRELAEPLFDTFENVVGFLASSDIDANINAVQGYPENVNISIDYDIDASRTVRGAANNRSFTARVFHSFLALPDDGYETRKEDLSVGYFSVAKRDLTRLDVLEQESLIRRWRLEKKDPEADLSEPVEPITFWIENTTPYAFRDYIRKGVLAWNEAFEAAGFKNALEIKQQPDDADWDAGDINYNVIRWEASPFLSQRAGFGPSIIDPRTGEIIAADILLNFTALNRQFGHWLTLTDYEWLDTEAPTGPVAQALNDANTAAGKRRSGNTRSVTGTAFVPFPESFARREEKAALATQPADAAAKTAALAPGPKPATGQLSALTRFGAIISEAGTVSDYRRRSRNKIRQPNARSPEDLRNQASLLDEGDDPAFSERMIREVIISLVMHEVGHTLGLMHNFAGSHYHPVDDIHDPEKTSGIISASIMDYVPINFAPPGIAQGDFANTRVGPYDVWAIKFGYDPDAAEGNNTRTELLRKAIEPGLKFARYTPEPEAMPYDLTTDPTRYAADTLELASAIIEDGNQWSVRESTQVNAAIFEQVFAMRLRAVSQLRGQLQPFRLAIDPQFGREDANRIVVDFTSRDQQEAALAALGDHLFDANGWQVPDGLVRRLGIFGVGQPSEDGGRLLLADALVRSLLSPSLVASMQRAADQGGDGFDAEEYLMAVKDLVVADGLSLTGNPGPDARAHHILYLAALDGLSRSFSPLPSFFGGYPEIERTRLREALEAVVVALERDLRFPGFWRPEAFRRHRAAMREKVGRLR